MLYTEQSLGTDSPLALLESLPLIPREDIMPVVEAVPLVEMKDHPDTFFTKYTDLCELSEEYDITVCEAADVVRESHMIPRGNFVVAIEDWVPMVDPNVVNAFDNVILTKQPANSVPNQLCEALLNPFLETRDETYVDLYIASILDESFAMQVLDEARRADKEAGTANKDTYKMSTEDLQKKIDETKKRREQWNGYANNKLLSDKSRAQWTDQMVKTDKELMNMEKALKDRQGVQASRSEDRKGATALQAPAEAPKMNDQGKVQVSQEDKNKRKEAVQQQRQNRTNMAAQGQQSNYAAANNLTPAPNPAQQQQNGWWAKNWSAFRNWMSNLGTDKSSAPSWLNNMVSKVKGWFNNGAQQAQGQAPAPAQNAQPAQTPPPAQQTPATPAPQPTQTPPPAQQAPATPPPAPATPAPAQDTQQQGGNFFTNGLSNGVNSVIDWLSRQTGYDLGQFKGAANQVAQNAVNSGVKKVQDAVRTQLGG